MSAAKKLENNVFPIAKRKKKNKFFYKVANHHELYKIGQSFYEDFENGIKSFAISSTGYSMGQQVSILGIASFFDQKKDLKIGIVSKDLALGVFGEVLLNSSPKASQTCEGEFLVHSFHNHFDLIEMNNLLNIVNNEHIRAYDDFIDSVMDDYDIIFWDVPELEDLTCNAEKYFPVIMKFEKLSIVVAKNSSSIKRLNEVQEFFKGYGVSLKGLLIKDEIESTQEKMGFLNKVKSWLK